LGPFCTIVALVPGLAFLFLGLKWRRRERELIEFTSWVRTYRRIAMPELARKLGKSEFETEKVLIDVVDKGLLRGFIDRDRNEFVGQEAIGLEVYIDVCPHCGGRVQKQYLVGETIRCPYCQSIIQPPARKVPKAG
jgi:hypothetical protein